MLLSETLYINTCSYVFSTCTSGIWECTDLNCPKICQIEEGTHITTFDGKYFNLIGDCSYYAIVVRELLLHQLILIIVTYFSKILCICNHIYLWNIFLSFAFWITFHRQRTGQWKLKCIHAIQHIDRHVYSE